jgi:ABC transporter substrate binding protein
MPLRCVVLWAWGTVRRREFITLIGGAVAWPTEVRAQNLPLPLVGFLSSLSAGALTGPVSAFRTGLQSIGYEDGKNVVIEFRWADGHYDQLPALAADLVRAHAAVIVTVGGDPTAFAAKVASQTIPIVFMVGRNPVELGLVTSLNRPGGNSTGVNLLIAEMESKRIEILRQVVPGASRFAVFINPQNADAEVQLNMVQAAAKALNQQIDTNRVWAIVTFYFYDCIDQAGVESRSPCLLPYQFAELWERRTRPWNRCLVRLTVSGKGPRSQNHEQCERNNPTIRHEVAARAQRRCSRAAKSCDELAPLHPSLPNNCRQGSTRPLSRQVERLRGSGAVGLHCERRS